MGARQPDAGRHRPDRGIVRTARCWKCSNCARSPRAASSAAPARSASTTRSASRRALRSSASTPRRSATIRPARSPARRLADGRLSRARSIWKWNLRDSTLYGHAFRSEGSARITGERVSRPTPTSARRQSADRARRLWDRGDALALTLDAPASRNSRPSGKLARPGNAQRHARQSARRFSGEADALQLPGGVELQGVTAELSGTLSTHEAEISAKAPKFALDAQARRAAAGAARAAGPVRSRPCATPARTRLR